MKFKIIAIIESEPGREIADYGLAERMKNAFGALLKDCTVISVVGDVPLTEIQQRAEKVFNDLMRNCWIEPQQRPKAREHALAIIERALQAAAPQPTDMPRKGNA